MLRNVVSFEIPTYLAATGLQSRLAPTRRVWIKDLVVAWAVIVALRAEEGDLAILLRDVQSWVGAAGLGAIRFGVDGRDYVLEGVELLSALAPS